MNKTTDTRACKNCTSYTDRGKCTKGKTFLTNQFTLEGEHIITSPHRNSVCVQHEMRRGLPKVFYIRPTTCADCFYFCAEQREFESFDNDDVLVCPAGCEYGNEVCTSGLDQTFRPMLASDKACEEHTTERELDIESERNQECVEREAAEAEAARQSEASAERITMQFLGKMRKEGAQ